MLISDQPKVLDRLLRDGNYSSLAALNCFGFFRSSTEYYFELLRMLLVFYERNLYFRNDLMDIAIAVYVFYSTYILYLVLSYCTILCRILTR